MLAEICLRQGSSGTFTLIPNHPETATDVSAYFILLFKVLMVDGMKNY